MWVILKEGTQKNKIQLRENMAIGGKGRNGILRQRFKQARHLYGMTDKSSITTGYKEVAKTKKQKCIQDICLLTYQNDVGFAVPIRLL